VSGRSWGRDERLQHSQRHALRYPRRNGEIGVRGVHSMVFSERRQNGFREHLRVTSSGHAILSSMVTQYEKCAAGSLAFGS